MIYSAPNKDGSPVKYRSRYDNFIGGEWCDSADGATSSVVDPSTGEEYARAVVSGPADVDRAMGAAEAAFESWRDTTPSERSLALIRIADAIEAHGDELMSIGDPLEPGMIYDSNRYSLHGMLSRLSVDIIDLGVVRDNPESMREALSEAAE